MLMDCELDGIPFTRSTASVEMRAPGSSWTADNGFRILPRLFAVPMLAAAPVSVRIGSSFKVSVETLWLISPPSVFSKGAAASTVTDSVAAPTSKSDVDTRVTRHFHLKPRAHVLLEAWHGNRQVVGARGQLRNGVIAGPRAGRGIHCAGGNVSRFDRRAGDDGAGWIGNGAGNCAAI